MSLQYCHLPQGSSSTLTLHSTSLFPLQPSPLPSSHTTLFLPRCSCQYSPSSNWSHSRELRSPFCKDTAYGLQGRKWRISVDSLGTRSPHQMLHISISMPRDTTSSNSKFSYLVCLLCWKNDWFKNRREDRMIHGIIKDQGYCFHLKLIANWFTIRPKDLNFDGSKSQ